MKNLPLVSILVPTYNRADTLGRTLKSILGQTFQDYEIVVIDDGSTDDTRSVIEDYKSKVHIKYLYQNNRGVAEARNTGIRNCSGEYIAFCDSDDFWLPEKLEKQMRLFAEDTALVYSDVYLFEDARGPKGRAHEFITLYRGWVYSDLLRKNFVATSSAIVRKSFLDRPFAGQTCEDWQMWLSVAKKGRFDFVDEPLVHYYEHSQGLSKSKAKLVRARLAIRKKEFKTLQDIRPPDVHLVKAVKRLVQKDRLVLCVFKMLPTRMVNKIDGVYYRSQLFRKIVSKTAWSS